MTLGGGRWRGVEKSGDRCSGAVMSAWGAGDGGTRGREEKVLDLEWMRDRRGEFQARRVGGQCIQGSV